jgi:hypothetical protein
VSTHVSTPVTVTETITNARPGADRPVVSPERGRGWAWVGVGAGVAGIASMVGSSLAGAVYEDGVRGDAQAIHDRLAEQTGQILFFHTATMLSAVLMVVFAAGLRRQLAHRVGFDSLLPTVAFGGLLLVSACQFLGAGLTTEFVFGVTEDGVIAPEAAAFFGHWIGTVPWLWGAAGLAGLAVAVAAFRHRAYPRWIGVASVGLGGLTGLFAVSPLQYMAGMTGPLWLTVVAAGLALARRGRH